MSRARERGSPRRHAGQWILLDARFHVLSIGSAMYLGTSPNNSLDATARRILLPRIRLASISRQPSNHVVGDRSDRWTVRVQTLHAPFSGELVALLGCYCSAEDAMPLPPLVGSWEWRVTPPGPRQRMRAYWSPALFQVYDMAVPAGEGPHGWEGAQWLDEIVMESDRAETRRVQENLCTATSDALRFHNLRVRSPESGQVFWIRMAGWREVASPGPEILLRGVSIRVADGSPDHGPTPGPPSYLEAMFALARDPFCAIDTRWEHLYLTSARFAELNVAMPPHRHLPQMCHEDDLPALRKMLEQATAISTTPVGPVRVRFATTTGGWTTLEFSGVGLRHSVQRPHHVLCRVRAVGDDARRRAR